MAIEIVTTVADVRSAVTAARRCGATVGFVPTMGALHAGHASLIRVARAACDFVVVSVFVNPTQFGPNEDFARYPRTFQEDCLLSERDGAHLVYAPSSAEVYPTGFGTFVDVGEIQTVYEGAIRPGHFRGVATVVLKLFNAVQPDWAVFGQKDAQQVHVIRQMVRDFDLSIVIDVAPTVREPDGLAMSSRNRYLEPAQRQNAVALFDALDGARVRIGAGERDVAVLCRGMADRVTAAPGAVLDYAAIVAVESFRPLTQLDRPAVAIIAARFGPTRLIDNMPLSPPG